MAIVALRPPPGCHEAAAEGLRLRIGRGQIDGFRGSFRLAVGIPRLVPPSSPRARLARAKTVTWDFLAFGDSEVGLVSVGIVNGSPRFAGLVGGIFAGRVLAACREAARTLDAASIVYAPSFVASGAAAAFALVLRRRRGVAAYVDILDGTLVPEDMLVVRRSARVLLDRIGRNEAGLVGAREASRMEDLA